MDRFKGFKGVKFGVPLKNYSSFRIGGPAKYFFEAHTAVKLARALKFAKKNRLRFLILGSGTNVLFKDEGFRGLVIRMSGTDFKLRVLLRGGRIIAEAGANLQKIVLDSAAAGLSCLEKLSGIPGTIGGAVRGNAGAREGQISDFIESVKVFDAAAEKVRVLKKSDLKFSYRNSLFKTRRDLIILSVVLRLKKAKNPGEILAAIKRAAERRNLTQPTGLCAGCVFMNPQKQNRGRQNRGRFSKRTVPLSALSAGELIDKAGLKGTRIGGAMISKLHGNFFINCGNATSNDMLRLIDLAKKCVYEKFKIRLKEEIEIVF